MGHLMNQAVIVLLWQVAVCWVAQNHVIQEPLQIALQPVLSTMHQLVSQPADSSYVTRWECRVRVVRGWFFFPLYPKLGNVMDSSDAVG